MLDKNTLGDSPAAIYLVDVLNHSTNTKDKNVLKTFTAFKKIFAELVKAQSAGHISTGVVNTFVSYKRQDLEIQTKEMLANGYTTLVVNLYKNLVIAELKKFQRKTGKIQLIEKSASDRAKALLRNKHQIFQNQSLMTYGRAGDEKFEMEVSFNEHGYARTTLDKNSVRDNINSQTLMAKSIARLERLGKTECLKPNQE